MQRGPGDCQTLIIMITIKIIQYHKLVFFIDFVVLIYFISSLFSNYILCNKKLSQKLVNQCLIERLSALAPQICSSNLLFFLVISPNRRIATSRLWNVLNLQIYSPNILFSVNSPKQKNCNFRVVKFSQFTNI